MYMCVYTLIIIKWCIHVYIYIYIHTYTLITNHNHILIMYISYTPYISSLPGRHGWPGAPMAQSSWTCRRPGDPGPP